jgi:FKBP-type peptidyl-prolyl cis-trans isomerase
MRPFRPIVPARLVVILAFVPFGALLACGDTKRSDPRADSAAAAAAASARVDSLEAIQLVTADTAIAPKLKVDLAKMEKRPSGLYVLDRRKGTGTPADSNHWVSVDYTTWLTDGTVVDDTKKSGPKKVLLGHKQVVGAWDEGLRGMREGGQRLLVAPAALGYGKAGQPGTVPRLATLVFQVDLRKVY